MSLARLLPLFVFVTVSGLLPAGEDPPPAKPEGLAERRMQVMAARIAQIAISSPDEGIPKRLQAPALFRYDDETRGYVDGTVWRLGEKGRPLAIITAELHPNYLGSGPKIVYDFLSLTERPFSARSEDVLNWTPGGSSVRMAALPKGSEPAAEATKRLTQIKSLARRFTGTQLIQETDATSVELRLLPKHIDRYTPDAGDRSDGAVFLLVNGRNPALVLLVETDGEKWQYGVGRLSLPSTLTLRLDGRKVWSEAQPVISWTSPYTASNRPVVVPQPEPAISLPGR